MVNMNVKLITWNNVALIFENVEVQIVKKNVQIKFDGDVSASEYELSKVEITFPDNGEFDAIIKECK
jgi:hypothetical protein